jgi:hypothetical protein
MYRNNNLYMTGVINMKDIFIIYSFANYKSIELYISKLQSHINITMIKQKFIFWKIIALFMIRFSHTSLFIYDNPIISESIHWELRQVIKAKKTLFIYSPNNRMKQSLNIFNYSKIIYIETISELLEWFKPVHDRFAKYSNKTYQN